MKLKTVTLTILSCVIPSLLSAQTISGEYTTEWQWDLNTNTNWVNLLRLDFQMDLGKNGSLEAATLSVAKTNETITEDWQTFSNIEEENNFCAIALLGYAHSWQKAHLFVGARNVNEDFFTSRVTSLFTSSSPGIFPTISASYPIANYPLSGLTLHFDIELGDFTFMNSIYNGKGYNGWNCHDNPFRINLSEDGFFDMMELSYARHDDHYFSAGAAIHNRFFAVDAEGEMAEIGEKKVSAAWWLYGEQTLWSSGDDKRLEVIAEYSENTNKQSGCRRYAEVGAAFTAGDNQVGLSAQYGEFFMGREKSVELTYCRELNDHVTLQPMFQYIYNPLGQFTIVSTRATITF